MRVNKVIAREQEVEWAIERQHEEQEVEWAIERQ
jgi:hypothetical protein